MDSKMFLKVHTQGASLDKLENNMRVYSKKQEKRLLQDTVIKVNKTKM